MSKTKRIIISLVITLVILIILNIVNNNIKSQEQVSAYVLTKSVVKGESITTDKLKEVKIDKGIENIQLITDISSKLYAYQNASVGQLLTQGLVSTVQIEDMEGYEYISIPINTSDDAVSYKIKKGSNVNLYYTAKLKQVSNVLKTNFELVYSTVESEAMVTAKLYENIKVVEVSDSVGSGDTLFTQVILMVKKEDIPMLINLKQLGTYTLTFTE